MSKYPTQEIDRIRAQALQDPTSVPNLPRGPIAFFSSTCSVRGGRVQDGLPKALRIVVRCARHR